jgi:hypothetical protein
VNARAKWAIVAIVAIVVLGGTTAFALSRWTDSRAAADSPGGAEIAGAGTWAGGDRIVFRNTAAGAGYGHIASVALADPSGTRTVDEGVCDRLDATPTRLACIRTVRGIVPAATAAVLAADGGVASEWPLSGVPSRTRLSPGGGLVATTAFVSGHSYASVGFSTRTTIRRMDGTELGDLEDWTLLIDGSPHAPVDRNYWGVTFADDTSFYATVGLTASGTTSLVRGDVSTRTLRALTENVECPSLSPDGTRIAFKRVTGGAPPAVHWSPAIYDIATGAVSVLPESRSIDDQIEWLDDDTVLYGIPRSDAPGDMDVWRLAADGSGAPSVLIEHAWSPAVVRG